MLLAKPPVIMPLLCAVALLCAACDDSVADKADRAEEQAALHKLNGKTMGTFWQVTIADPVADEGGVLGAIESVLADVNQDMSTYIADSAISQFNRRRDTDPHKISAGFMKNILAARAISEASDGVYDITIAPLVNVWGFGPDKVSTPPTQAQIDEAVALVGYQQLLVDAQNGTIAKANPAVQIDLSSIAKGYGVDAVAAKLDALGYHNFLVDIGGELLARGHKQDGPWQVAIEQPVAGRHVQQIIALNQDGVEQTAMATSGNYRNFIDYDGKRVVHTLDPRTGRSAQSRLLSVTVVADDCMYADGYATALMALGADGAAAFARRQHIPALFIYAADDQGRHGFDVVQSEAWKARFGE